MLLSNNCQWTHNCLWIIYYRSAIPLLLYLFIPCPRSRGGEHCHHHVWPCVYVSPFRFRRITRKPLAGLFSYCINTSLKRCRYVYWGLRPLTYFFTFNFGAIIDFNWWRMINSASGRYLEKRLLDCFHIKHLHALGGYDLRFSGLFLL